MHQRLALSAKRFKYLHESTHMYLPNEKRIYVIFLMRAENYHKKRINIIKVECFLVTTVYEECLLYANRIKIKSRTFIPVYNLLKIAKFYT